MGLSCILDEGTVVCSMGSALLISIKGIAEILQLVGGETRGLDYDSIRQSKGKEISGYVVFLFGHAFGKD